jgi:hypothetical protein
LIDLCLSRGGTNAGYGIGSPKSMVQVGIVGVGITHLPLQHIWLTAQQTPAQHSPAEQTRPSSQTLDPVLP